MENLTQSIDTMLDNGARVIVAVGLLYVGAVATTYSIVESHQTKVKSHIPEAAQIELSHLYNPITFWQDNVELVQKGKDLREEYIDLMPKYGSFPTSG